MDFPRQMPQQQNMAYDPDGWQPQASSRGGPALSIYTSHADTTSQCIANSYWRVGATDYRHVKETILQQAAVTSATPDVREIPVLVMGNDGHFALVGMRVQRQGANIGQITVTNRKALV